jgi:hypothetical protein
MTARETTMNTWIALMLTLLLAAACGPPKIKRIDLCQTMDLPMAENPPSKGKLETGQTRAVVTHFADREWSTLANGAVSVTEQSLANAGVEIVDRAASKQLVGEVKLAELKGSRKAYKGPEVADNVVVVRVNSADVTGEYVEEQRNDKGKIIMSAQCKLTGTLTGNLRIYAVPEMRAVKLIELNGSATHFESARGQNCERKAPNPTLTRLAGEAALNDVQAELKNFFAPMGYVLERRRCPSEGDAFKLSIGTNSGLKAGDEVGVFTLHLVENPLTHIANLEEEKVASGKVSDQAYANHAWLAGVSAADASRVHLGDYIQVFYKSALGVQARRWFSNTFRGGN